MKNSNKWIVNFFIFISCLFLILDKQITVEAYGKYEAYELNSEDVVQLDETQGQSDELNEQEHFMNFEINETARDTQSQLDLVYGNTSLSDENAIIFFITGDGFNQNEQSKFWLEATKKANELISESPFDEFKEQIKVYGYNVISNDSGARGDGANSYQEALNDTKDTYFGSTFWYGGTERLLAISAEGTKKVQALSTSQLSKVDQEILIVNTETYGGSGGSVAVCSLNDPWSKELMLHEIGHSFAGLVDNYYAGDAFLKEAPNLTQETDPDKVKWKNRLGSNGIGIYEMVAGWYKPSTNCKMEFLGSPFSDVAKDAIRDACRNTLPENEVGTSESIGSETSTSESTGSETSTSESSESEVSTSESTGSETSTSESTESETSTSESTGSETSTSESSESEVSTSESTGSETSTSESSESEVSTSESTGSETSTSESSKGNENNENEQGVESLPSTGSKHSTGVILIGSSLLLVVLIYKQRHLVK